MADMSISPGAVPRELAPGSDLGPYRIDGLLGTGGMGTVYRARQVHLQRVVALKVMKPGLAANHDFCERFMREARAGAAITHPNVVMIHDADIRDGLLYQVFEFVPGGDLWQLIQKRGALPPATALNIIAECASGLDAIHALGLLHRDLKPQNIFLDGAGRAKLGDLGMAVQADGGDDAITATGVVMGTPAYMSPEQARGKNAEAASDVYALGATLFSLLTARKPFPGANTLDVITKVVNAPVPDPREVVPTIPAVVADLVKRTMSKRPAERPTAARLREECLALAAAIPASATRISSARVAATEALDASPTPSTQRPAAPAKMASNPALRAPVASDADKRRDPKTTSSAHLTPPAPRSATAELTPPARPAVRSATRSSSANLRPPSSGTAEIPGPRGAPAPAPAPAARPRRDGKPSTRPTRAKSTGAIATGIAVAVVVVAVAVTALAMGSHGGAPPPSPRSDQPLEATATNPPSQIPPVAKSPSTTQDPITLPPAQNPATPPPAQDPSTPPPTPQPVAQDPAPPPPAPTPPPPAQDPANTVPSPTPVFTSAMAIANPTPVPGLDPQLLGNIFSDGGGAYANAPNTADKAFDGDTTTVYDAWIGNDSYTGIDLGANHAATVTSIRFYARYAYADRMKGGIFEGTNDPAAGWHTLATVDTASASAWTVLTVSGALPYRYLRYRSPVQGYCNVAEIEFHGR
jgi:serine/threonine-protein kinase